MEKIFWRLMRRKLNLLESLSPVTSGIKLTQHFIEHVKHGGGDVMVRGYFAASGPGWPAVNDGNKNSPVYEETSSDQMIHGLVTQWGICLSFHKSWESLLSCYCFGQISVTWSWILSWTWNKISQLSLVYALQPVYVRKTSKCLAGHPTCEMWSTQSYCVIDILVSHQRPTRQHYFEKAFTAGFGLISLLWSRWFLFDLHLKTYWQKLKLCWKWVIHHAEHFITFHFCQS